LFRVTGFTLSLLVLDCLKSSTALYATANKVLPYNILCRERSGLLASVSFTCKDFK